MAYDGQCGSCANFEDKNGRGMYDKDNPSYVKGFCNWYRCYYYPDDSCDSHYRYRGYVTTMISKRLGLEKDNNTINTIIDFQKNVMENNKRYEPHLKKYDVIGPKISKELEREDISVVQKIYDIFLMPVAKLIENKKYDQAIFRYKYMLEILKGHYNISSKKSNDYNNVTTNNAVKKLVVKKNI